MFNEQPIVLREAHNSHFNSHFNFLFNSHFNSLFNSHLQLAKVD